MEYLEKPTPVFPPQTLLNDCLKSELQGSKTEDLLNLAIERGFNLDSCNEDKKALREWKSNIENSSTDDKSLD